MAVLHGKRAPKTPNQSFCHHSDVPVITHLDFHLHEHVFSVTYDSKAIACIKSLHVKGNVMGFPVVPYTNV